MANKSTKIPPAPDEFRRNYRSKFAPVPIEEKYLKQYERLNDKESAELFRLIIRHAMTKDAEQPQENETFFVCSLLEDMDKYLEMGLQSKWAAEYRGQAGKEAAKRGRDPQGGLKGTSREANNNVNTNVNTNANENENTNTNQSREESRGDGGKGVSFSDGGRVPSLQEYLKYCREILLPYDFANSLWVEMAAAGWTYDKDGKRTEVQKWKNYVQYRAKRSEVHPATLQEIESASNAILQEYRKNPEWVDINKFIYLFGREPNEYDCYK